MIFKHELFENEERRLSEQSCGFPAALTSLPGSVLTPAFSRRCINRPGRGCSRVVDACSDLNRTTQLIVAQREFVFVLHLTCSLPHGQHIHHDTTRRIVHREMAGIDIKPKLRESWARRKDQCSTCYQMPSRSTAYEPIHGTRRQLGFLHEAQQLYMPGCLQVPSGIVIYCLCSGPFH